MKKRALEARILRNVDKAAEFDKYMANKIWGGTEKRPIVINLERVVDKIKVKQFNDLLSSSVLNSLNQSKKKVQEAFSGSNRKA